jgi:hypothetical protein
LTSPYVRPDQLPLADLERLLGHLTEELGAWRRRCQKAELEVQSLKTQGGMVPGDDVMRMRSRVVDLERDNIDLHRRVERARELVTVLQQRLAFLEADAVVEVSR